MEIPGYRDLTVLGRGGFSTVYRAVQDSVQREVALKVLGVHMAGADAKDRFRRECATNGRVGTHPNIVTLFDSGFADDGSPYLAMQLCSGGSFSERLRASGPLPVAEVLRVGIKISAALQYAHSAGVLHRDIKPENILISDFGEPELADFGISSVDDQRLSTVTASSFTINHAAPEALAGQGSSISTDVYSLCSTLYTLVAGHTPFNAPSSTALVALVNMVMNQPAPTTGRADVPPSLERLLAAGLSKTPELRPPDGRAVGGALQAVQRELGLPVTEFPTAPPPLAYSPTQSFAAVEGAGPGGPGPGAAALGGAALGGAGVGGAALGAARARGVPPIDTGALPPTGAMPPAGAMPFPTQAGGQWGAWANEVSADRSASLPPSAILPVLAPAPDFRRLATPPPKSDRRVWIVLAAVLAVILIAGGVYYAVSRSSSSSATPNPGSSSASSRPATSKASSALSTKPATTRATTTAPSTTTSATTRTTPSTSRSTSTSATAVDQAVINAFGSTTVPAGSIDCASTSSSVSLSMAWQTTGATQAWIGIDTADAQKNQYASVPTQSDNYPISYACSSSSHRFTLTVVNSAGQSKSTTVTYTSQYPGTTTSTPTTPSTSTTPTTPTTPSTSTTSSSAKTS